MSAGPFRNASPLESGLASPSRPRLSGEAGFTLVEMLVSLLIFGLVAGIATLLTTGATRSLAASSGALAAVSDLESLRTVLAADLGQAARRPSLAPDGRPMPAFTLTPQGFVLTRFRPGGVLPEVEKVAWGLDDGRLLRQPFAAIDGGAPGEAVELARGFTGIRLRVAGEAGWQDGWAPTSPEALPRAVELTLLRADGVPVTMKFLVAA